jgi:hypothetical protein
MLITVVISAEENSHAAAAVDCIIYYIHSCVAIHAYIGKLIHWFISLLHYLVETREGVSLSLIYVHRSADNGRLHLLDGYLPWNRLMSIEMRYLNGRSFYAYYLHYIFPK